MITYVHPWPELTNVKVPKLHRVSYNPKYNWGEVQYWCKENCRSPAYTAPSWTGKQFVEFEDDEDAVVFALRFA